MNFRDIVDAKLTNLDFPDGQYIKKKVIKKQICLHHTASGKGISGDFRHWLKSPERIATCVIVDYEGTINQLFSSLYWGYHLGVKSSSLRARGIRNMHSKTLNQICIGLEIDGWGQLKERDGKFYAYPNKFGTRGKGSIVLPDDITFYEDGYKGYNAYESYTEAQIKTVEQLLLYWNFYYGIPLDYNEDIWAVTDRALSGEKGVYTHNSYRKDKRDVHPQPELITMLQGVSNKITW